MDLKSVPNSTDEFRSFFLANGIDVGHITEFTQIEAQDIISTSAKAGTIYYTEHPTTADRYLFLPPARNSDATN